MVASATPRNADARVVAVAVSGGRDSIALLHATARLAADLGVQVLALHVHHGLQPQADDWARGVRERCRRLRARGLPVQFAMRRLDGAPRRGDSVEAWARRGRYEALTSMAREAGASLVLLAHHRRDQAETFVLQALRGGGPAGLSAMPRRIQRDGLVWARPWLDAGDDAIDAYARRHRLRAVDDPSNAHADFARSRLRTQVMPALRQAFPQAEAALAAAAQRAQLARACLDEVAADDLRTLCDRDGALRVDRWLALSPARAANALRAWLQRQSARGVPDSLLQRLRDELPQCHSARWPLPGGHLQLHRQRLRRVDVQVAEGAAAAVPATVVLAVDAVGRYEVPAWAGSLHVRRSLAQGLDAGLLGELELKPRRGGERFQSAPHAVPRSLKKQFQAAGVPDAARHVPLVYACGRLVFVPGLGVDARAQAPAGEPQFVLEWRPDADAPRASGRRRPPP